MFKTNYQTQLFFFLLIVSTAFLLPRCQSTEPIPQFSVEENWFQTNCSSCHGEQMQAFVDRRWKFGTSREELFNSIKYGNDSLGMPSWDSLFTDKQIDSLVTYIKFGIDNVDKYKFEDSTIASDTFEAEGFSFYLDTVFSGSRVLWGIAFLPDNEILITSIDGNLYHVDKNRQSREIEGVPEVKAEGQGGLLDVELHPDFVNNKYIYLSYSAFKEEDGQTLTTTVVDRAIFSDNKLTEVTRIFEALPYLPTRHHYGSRLEFDNEGYLFISVGDRGRRDDNPQYLNNHCGKVHRVHDDGSIPADNPFVDKEGALPSIFAYGIRNPQGMVKHPVTGKIWEHEHGPRGGDEINIIRPGSNYGWPEVSYGINYDGTTYTNVLEREDVDPPVLYWVPSIAPSGMDFIKSDLYPGWKNQLLVGSLRFKYLNLCFLDGEKVTREEKLLKNIGRVRDVKTGPDGYIYVSVEDPGRIYRLVPILK
jgi:glucose/arabinose dehydrogenase